MEEGARQGRRRHGKGNPPAGDRKRRWLVALLAGVLAACLVLPLLLHRPGPHKAARLQALSEPPPVQPRPVGRRDTYSTLEPIPAALSKAPRITLGAHLENAYNLSVPEQTFMADGWYWLSWPEEVETMIEAQKIKTEEMVEVVNNIIGYDFNVEADNEEPELRADGSHYQLFRFSGSFYIDSVDLHDYPFNNLSLPLIFETRPLSFALDGPTPVLLVPDPDQQGMVGAYATIKGYQERGVSLRPLIHRYATDFGNREGRRAYAMTELRVYYRTPWLTAFLQWVMPLLIVMAVVFLAPSLEGSLGDLRIAIPSTALLTLVVMQQTYQAEMPPLPYLTFLDEIYIYCYLVSIALFILFLWGSNTYAAAEGAEPAELERIRLRVARADLGFQLIACAGLLVVGLLAWLT